MRKIISFFKLGWLPNFSEKFPEGYELGDFGYGAARWGKILFYYFNILTDRLIEKFRAQPQKTRFIIIFAKVAFIVIVFAGTIGFDMFGTAYLSWIVYGLTKDKTEVQKTVEEREADRIADAITNRGGGVI